MRVSNDSSAWIIGASSGIGRALALKLAADGWRVWLSARNEEALQALRDEQPQAFRVLPVDVTDEQSIHRSAAMLREQEPQLRSVFVNAGAYDPMSVKDFSVDAFARMNRVNYLGAVQVLSEVLPWFRERGNGDVYLTASVSGYRGLPYAAPYSATKAALINLAESLHPELLQEGVRLRVINPGFVRSPLTDKNDFSMPFLIEPEEAAEAIVKALDHNGFEIVFPKRMKWAMKFLSVLPYSLYFWLTRKMLT